MGEVELIGGPEKRPIIIEPYNPADLNCSKTIGRIAALAGVPRRVDHIGSTAVAGLAAKPGHRYAPERPPTNCRMSRC